MGCRIHSKTLSPYHVNFNHFQLPLLENAIWLGQQASGSMAQTLKYTEACHHMHFHS